jgi:hypothetical protein
VLSMSKIKIENPTGHYSFTEKWILFEFLYSISPKISYLQGEK